MKSFDDWVGDTRLYRPRGTSAESGPRFFQQWRRSLSPSTPTARSASESSPAGAAAVHPGRDRGCACVAGVTGESPRARARPRSRGPAGASGRRATGEASRRRAPSEVAHTTSTVNTTTTPLDDTPDRATRLPLTARPASLYPLPATSPSRPPPPSARPPLLPCSLLLPSGPHARPTSACRRPASGPPATCLGCPADLSGRSRKGGPARSGGPPFLESPGLMRDLGRRWGGGPLISKHQHQEINTRRSTSHPGCMCASRRTPRPTHL